jgi:hypothetical protein
MDYVEFKLAVDEISGVQTKAFIMNELEHRLLRLIPTEREGEEGLEGALLEEGEKEKDSEERRKPETDAKGKSSEELLKEYKLSNSEKQQFSKFKQEFQKHGQDSQPKNDKLE